MTPACLGCWPIGGSPPLTDPGRLAPGGGTRYNSVIVLSFELSYVGGPTALIQVGGVRLLTDPTFDPAGQHYSFGPGIGSTKTQDPAISLDELGPIDAVLLSHDQHDDNLDRRGRDALNIAQKVLTTVAGARRLGGNAVGLRPWEAAVVTGADGDRITVTAAPARHGNTGVNLLAGPPIHLRRQRVLQRHREGRQSLRGQCSRDPLRRRAIPDLRSGALHVRRRRGPARRPNASGAHRGAHPLRGLDPFPYAPPRDPVRVCRRRQVRPAVLAHPGPGREPGGLRPARLRVIRFIGMRSPWRGR